MRIIINLGVSILNIQFAEISAECFSRISGDII